MVPRVNRRGSCVERAEPCPPNPFPLMAKHKHNRVRLLTAHDAVLFVRPNAARDMIEKGEAVIISLSPLVIREARFLRYKRDARDQRGRVIPGVMRPDPDRVTESEIRRAYQAYGGFPRRFDHHPAAGSNQGRCFPREDISEGEREFRAYKRDFLRKHALEEYAKSLRDEEIKAEIEQAQKRFASHGRNIPLPDERTKWRKLNKLARRYA